MGSYQHTPVLLEQLLELLSPRPGGVYVDANLGGGGFSKAVLDRIGSEGRVLGIDLDPAALSAARERLRAYPSFEAVAANFADLDTVLEEAGLDGIDGVIFDLGLSSYQLDHAERGFSFARPGPLDMRFDPSAPTSARDLVNDLDERELEEIIREYGEERWARAIARRIVARRREAPIETTAELAELVAEAIPRKFHPPRTHPATRTFQGLRIAVNDELRSLERGLEAAVRNLRPGGRLCCLSYHSLEDRIVKRTLLRFSGADPERPQGLPRGLAPSGPPALLRILTRHPLTPSDIEVQENPRARSARLRAAERLSEPGGSR